ncbi:ADP-forming succinate--CoA ligase subunit beta [Candidatus Peregrinibacteria bacterium]|nr:ADP-forming succinate--CoA ligase subunit beta [Candidatus Peregrinibacteria bacterium]
MFLKEFEGRELFRKYGVPVARGVLVQREDDIDEKVAEFLEETGANEVVVKAQLLSGKRGKRGGIVFANRDEAGQKARDFLGSMIGDEVVEEVFIQEKIEIQSELYVSVLVDRLWRMPMVVFSEEGGMNIEELASEHPEKILSRAVAVGVRGDNAAKFLMDFFKQHEVLDDASRKQLVEICVELLEVLYKEEATLVEVNPLILKPDGKLVAVDAKTIIDNNALARHPEFDHESVQGQTVLELKAREHDLAYVELDGDIAVIGNGAGLVMATLDAVDFYGGKPANFCDIGGGASAEKVQQAMEIVLQKKGVRKLFINIFGGITHCDEVAEGILAAINGMDGSIDMVIRMVGTNDRKAQTLLKEAGYDFYLSFEDAAQRVAQ